MVIGYARAHSRDRDLRLQRAALQKAGCEHIVEVPQTDVQAHREGLMRALDLLNRGDVLVVRKLDRLATSLKQWMAVSAVLLDRGIGLNVLDDGQDTGDPSGNVMGRLLSALAEYEQARRKKRTQGGSRSMARGKGRRGRPCGVNEAKRDAALRLKSETSCSVTEICEIVGISRPTFYRYNRSSIEASGAESQLEQTEATSHVRRV